MKAQMQTPNHLSPNKNNIFILLLKLILVEHGIFLCDTYEINFKNLYHSVHISSSPALLELYYNYVCKLVLCSEESGLDEMQKQVTFYSPHPQDQL